jgi:hypothetical protein
MNNTMPGLENVLTFADLQIVARSVAPIFLRDTFLNFLLGLRLSGIIISFILLILILFFGIRLKRMKSKKETKIGLSGIEKESLLYDTKINAMFKKINDYISFENILY